MPSANDCLSRDAAAAADSLSVMMEKERKNLSSDYLNQSCLSATEATVTESDRMLIVDWCYAIVDTCKFNRETVAMTMGMVDRFLSNPSIPTQKYLNDRSQYQLLAVAALYVSIKINEPRPFGSDVFADESNGIFSAEEIESMEMTILQGIGWRINAPTSVQIAYHILSAISPNVNIDDKTWEFILDEVRFQSEYAVRDYYFSTRLPSVAAMSAILNACDQVDEQVCKDIVYAFLFLMGDKFTSPQELFAAKNRLQCLTDLDKPEGEDASRSLPKCTNELTPNTSTNMMYQEKYQ